MHRFCLGNTTNPGVTPETPDSSSRMSWKGRHPSSVFSRPTLPCKFWADMEQGLAPSVIEIARADRGRRRRPEADL
jgi:hypothetical protein